MTGCLDGIKVLELARYQAGPRAGMVMSDMGAEVIKVEKPGGEETRAHAPLVNGTSVYFTVYNRGKKSITLNMRAEEGKAIFRELVKTADVVLENFRPGVIAKMGFSYEELKKIKPDIILTSVSGFGQYGPYRDRPAFDPIGQAMSGLMEITGIHEGHPVLTGSPIIDRITSLHACIGTLGAIIHRNATGEGQVIDVSLLDTGVTLMENSHLSPHGHRAQGPKTTTPPSIRPRMATWRSLLPPGPSGRGSLSLWTATSLLKTPASSALRQTKARRPSAWHSSTEWVASNNVADITEKLVANEVPVGPVQTPAQMSRDPHLSERQMMVEVPTESGKGTIMAPGLSIKFSKTKGALGKVPAAGEHTCEILSRLPGMTAEKIEELHGRGVL